MHIHNSKQSFTLLKVCISSKVHTVYNSFSQPPVKMLCFGSVSVFFNNQRISIYTSKQAALPKSSWQLQPKVLRENKSPGVGLALQASINHKGLIKSYIVGGDLQFKSLFLTLYQLHGSSSYVGAPTHKCPASINMLQVPTFKWKKGTLARVCSQCVSQSFGGTNN